MDKEISKEKDFVEVEKNVSEEENFDKAKYDELVKTQEDLTNQIKKQNEIISNQQTQINEFKELINTSSKSKKEEFNLIDSLVEDYGKNKR